MKRMPWYAWLACAFAAALIIAGATGAFGQTINKNDTTIVDSTAAAKVIGDLLTYPVGQTPWPMVKWALYEPERRIGKSYSPRLDFLDVPEVTSRPFQSAVLPIPTWEQAWPYVATVGILITIIAVALIAG